MPAACDPCPGKRKAMEFMRCLFRDCAEASAGELLFNAAVDARVVELPGHADGVFDGVGVGASMAYDGHAFNAEQRGSTILRVVEAPAEIGEGLSRQQGADLRGDG